MVTEIFPTLNTFKYWFILSPSSLLQVQIPEQSERPLVPGNDSPRVAPLLSAAHQEAAQTPALKSFLGLRGGAPPQKQTNKKGTN